ncbi:MAG: tandem-95 repeat protein [Alcanivoracaceae bacterium]|nr:tandem-95 repeat protein [Alcanivoracaceae bacterium]
MKKTTKNLILTSTLASIIISAGAADDTQSLDQINYAYSGDQARLGIGVTEDGAIIGDFLKSFNSNYRSNWMAQGWFSDGAGGLELDYHWVSGVQSEQDLIDNGDDYKVNKLFFALDQNSYDDRKLTLGGGREVKDKFWNIYASTAISGARLVSNTSVFENNVLNGNIGGVDFIQAQTIETITRTFEHPYDWGVGGRIGKYFNAHLVRVTGGLDYEDGDFNSDQLTASIDIEKYFNNTGHSIALHLEQVEKDGDFEIDRNDTRAYIMYRYDFGQTYQPTERYEEVKVVDEEALAMLKEQRKLVIQNEIDLSSMAFFNLDSSVLREDTMSVLKDVISQIKAQKLGSKINIVGHTCSIGTDDYNQTLSEKRARSAREFFIAQGIEANLIISSGKGETEAAFDNNGPDIAKNRRVAVSFLTIETEYREAVIPAEDVPVKWVKQQVKIAPSWLARALHNPAKHKRTVDVYKYQEQEQIETLGDIVFLNQAPVADNDNLTVFRNTSATFIDVLNNDSDPDNDTLTITDVLQPVNGSVVNNGTSLTYTPNMGFIGTDTFIYTIDDNNGDQATAEVTITVENNAPVANSDSGVVVGTEALIINVLNNDIDSDGTVLIVKSVTQAQNGSVVNNEDGTVTYQANEGFDGLDSFSYIISDEDGAESTATVTITVEPEPVEPPEPENNLPIAVDDMLMIPVNASIDFNPLDNDSDPDGDVISVESVDTSTLPGALTVNEDGSMHYQAPFLFHGNVSFTYTITDGKGGTATATVGIWIAD